MKWGEQVKGKNIEGVLNGLEGLLMRSTMTLCDVGRNINCCVEDRCDNYDYPELMGGQMMYRDDTNSPSEVVADRETEGGGGVIICILHVVCSMYLKSKRDE